MDLSENSQAILLLAGHFGARSSSTAKPLTVGEWGEFADYLRSKNVKPEKLLGADVSAELEGFSHKTISVDRVESLLRRGTAMGFSMEKWRRAGLWVVSRADDDYPKRLKTKLQSNSPPILYGCGDKTLLNRDGIGVVGSRKASTQDLDYTAALGKKIAAAELSVVSGGARGIDEAAMLAALQAEGTVIGILADNLLRASTKPQYRDFLKRNRLVLISPSYPEERFHVGTAMARNKYIYCLSVATVVVHSGRPDVKGKNGGGTWEGASENLKRDWVPLWVKRSNDGSAGNAQIEGNGGHWLSDNINEVDINGLLHAPDKSADEFSSDPVSAPSESTAETSHHTSVDPVAEPVQSVVDSAEVSRRSPKETTFYEFFLEKAESLLREAKSPDELAEQLQVNKPQLNVWLKNATEGGHISKLSKPVRYQWRSTDETLKLFPDEA